MSDLQAYSFKQVVEICRKFEESQGYWPRIDTSHEAFEQAGMPGMHGGDLFSLVAKPSAAMQADPDYQAILALALKNGVGRVDLSLINPKTALEIPEVSLAGILGAIDGQIRHATDEKSRTVHMHVEMPMSLADRVCERAGVKPDAMKKMAYLLDVWVPVNRHMQAYLAQHNQDKYIDAYSAARTFTLKILNGGMLCFRNNHTMSTLYAGEMSLQMWAKIEDRLAQRIKESVGQMPTAQKNTLLVIRGEPVARVFRRFKEGERVKFEWYGAVETGVVKSDTRNSQGIVDGHQVEVLPDSPEVRKTTEYVRMPALSFWVDGETQKDNGAEEPELESPAPR